MMTTTPTMMIMLNEISFVWIWGGGGEEISVMVISDFKKNYF